MPYWHLLLAPKEGVWPSATNWGPLHGVLIQFLSHKECPDVDESNEQNCPKLLFIIFCRTPKGTPKAKSSSYLLEWMYEKVKQSNIAH